MKGLILTAIGGVIILIRFIIKRKEKRKKK
jgi:uncharacterized membrane-anchored protein